MESRSTSASCRALECCYRLRQTERATLQKVCRVIENNEGLSERVEAVSKVETQLKESLLEISVLQVGLACTSLRKRTDGEGK